MVRVRVSLGRRARLKLTTNDLQEFLSDLHYNSSIVFFSTNKAIAAILIASLTLKLALTLQWLVPCVPWLSTYNYVL